MPGQFLLHGLPAGRIGVPYLPLKTVAAMLQQTSAGLELQAAT